MEFLRTTVCIFFIYSIIGWIIEVINCYGWYGKIVNRGFLIGPYCPIYGCGAVLMTFIIPENNDFCFKVCLTNLVTSSVLSFLIEEEAFLK